MAEEIATEEARVAEEKAAEEKKIADEKSAAEEARIAEDKRIAEEKAAEDARIAEEKAAGEAMEQTLQDENDVAQPDNSNNNNNDNIAENDEKYLVTMSESTLDDRSRGAIVTGRRIMETKLQPQSGTRKLIGHSSPASERVFLYFSFEHFLKILMQKLERNCGGREENFN